jgi:hypothetical protein
MAQSFFLDRKPGTNVMKPGAGIDSSHERWGRDLSYAWNTDAEKESPESPEDPLETLKTSEVHLTVQKDV